MQDLFYKLTHSLNGLRLLISVVMVAIAALLLYLTWVLVSENHLSEAEVDRKVHQNMLHAKAVVLEGILKRHEHTVRHLAQESAAADQVQFGDSDDQEMWALESRRFLTDSLGVALIQADGTIGGDPARLRMGPQCVHDLQRALAGEDLPRPLLHQDVEGLEHLDMIAPIRASEGGTAGGPVVGYLFASFHLSVIREWLGALTDPGYRLSVTSNETDDLVCELNRLPEQTEGAVLETLSEPIPGTRLSLNLTRPVIVSNEFFGRLTMLLFFGLLALVALPLLASFRFWRLVKNDFCTLHEQLTEIGRGVVKPERPDRPTLLDIQPIADEMYALVTRIGKQQSNLSHQSMHDHLTGLPNRRYIEEELVRICAQAQRGVNHSVMLLDLDHFKKVNDSIGHDAGDAVLTCFSECLRQKLRAADFAGRWAGDEFVVISSTPASDADKEGDNLEQVVARLRRCFADEQRELLAGSGIEVTLSIGRVALNPQANCRHDEVMQRADEALYAAKDRGRNTLVDYATISDKGSGSEANDSNGPRPDGQD